MDGSDIVITVILHEVMRQHVWLVAVAKEGGRTAFFLKKKKKTSPPIYILILMTHSYINDCTNTH